MPILGAWDAQRHHRLTGGGAGAKRKKHGGVAMLHTEGSIRISRRSPETEPEPWRYEISFAPYAASNFPPACDVVGDEQLKRALCFGLGLSEPSLGHSV